MLATLNGLDAHADDEKHFPGLRRAADIALNFPGSKLSIAENALEHVKCFGIEQT